jgi:hypothetical protein
MLGMQTNHQKIDHVQVTPPPPPKHTVCHTNNYSPLPQPQVPLVKLDDTLYKLVDQMEMLTSAPTLFRQSHHQTDHLTNMCWLHTSPPPPHRHLYPYPNTHVTKAQNHVSYNCRCPW